MNLFLWPRKQHKLFKKGGIIRRGIRINGFIRSSNVRLIGADGEQFGIVETRDALRKSEEADLDLVEIAPQANPPVCRIMDFSKYKYEQEKKEREAKKHRKTQQTKEVRLSPTIDQHDYHTKIAQAEKFLQKGKKVKFRLRFKGREMKHKEVGREIIDKVAQDLSAVGKMDKVPQQIGRMLIMILGPK